MEAGKGVLKAGASLPVFAYEQVRHPIRTEKDIITYQIFPGVAADERRIPEYIKGRSGGFDSLGIALQCGSRRCA